MDQLTEAEWRMLDRAMLDKISKLEGDAQNLRALRDKLRVDLDPHYEPDHA